MANILSQEEIDALLGGLSGGQIETGEQRPADEPKRAAIAPFDFADQDRYLRGRLPTLETIHDRFARQLRLNMTTALRRMVEIQISSQTICSFGDFSRSLEKPSSLHILKMEPLKGSGLLVLPGRLILTMVDLMFGGRGRAIEIPEQRDFTMIETKVIRKIAEDICRSYTDSWSAVYPVSVQLVGSETNIQFVSIAQNSEPVNVVDCDVTIEGNRSALSICLPYASLEPIKDLLKGSFVDKNDVDQVWVGKIKSSLMEASLEVLGVLGTAQITGRELLALKPGDILELDEDCEHPVEVKVGGIRKFWGAVGAYKSGRALQITGVEDSKGRQS